MLRQQRTLPNRAAADPGRGPPSPLQQTRMSAPEVGSVSRCRALPVSARSTLRRCCVPACRRPDQPGRRHRPAGLEVLEEDKDEETKTFAHPI